MGRSIIKDPIKLKKIADIYINENITIEKLANQYSLSKITLLRYLSGKQAVFLDIETQEKVDAKKRENWLNRNATKGAKKKYFINKEEAVKFANLVIENDYTVNDFENIYGSSDGPCSTTIYEALNEENLGEELYKKLTDLYAEHKKRCLKKTREKN